MRRDFLLHQMVVTKLLTVILLYKILGFVNLDKMLNTITCSTSCSVRYIGILNFVRSFSSQAPSGNNVQW